MGQRTTPTHQVSPLPGARQFWPRCHTPTSLGELARARAPGLSRGLPHAGAPPDSVPPQPLPSRRRKRNPVPATYLKEPVAPPVEGGDDGGMDIAAVQALGREEKREFSWKEGREAGRRRNREGARKDGRQGQRPGDRGRAPLRLAPGPRTRSVTGLCLRGTDGNARGTHDGQLGAYSFGGHGLV